MGKTTRKQIDKQETRERILEGASLLFAEQGYAAASISKIAKKAGVLPGSIYWAFESKEQIFAAVLERAGQIWKDRFMPNLNEAVPTMLDEAVSTMEAYTAYFEKLAVAFEEAPEFLRLIMVVASERQAGSSEILAAARDVRHFWRSRIEVAISEVLEGYESRAVVDFSKRFSRLTIQMLDGVFLSSQLEPEEASIQDLFHHAAEICARELQHGIETLPKQGE